MRMGERQGHEPSGPTVAVARKDNVKTRDDRQDGEGARVCRTGGNVGRKRSNESQGGAGGATKAGEMKKAIWTGKSGKAHEKSRKIAAGRAGANQGGRRRNKERKAEGGRPQKHGAQGTVAIRKQQRDQADRQHRGSKHSPGRGNARKRRNGAGSRPKAKREEGRQTRARSAGSGPKSRGAGSQRGSRGRGGRETEPAGRATRETPIGGSEAEKERRPRRARNMTGEGMKRAEAVRGPESEGRDGRRRKVQRAADKKIGQNVKGGNKHQGSGAHDRIAERRARVATPAARKWTLATRVVRQGQAVRQRREAATRQETGGGVNSVQQTG